MEVKRNPDGTIKVRIKATGQVLDLVPSAAFPMLHGGTAELADEESMTLAPIAERAVAAAQSGPRKKTAARR